MNNLQRIASDISGYCPVCHIRHNDGMQEFYDIVDFKAKVAFVKRISKRRNYCLPLSENEAQQIVSFCEMLCMQPNAREYWDKLKEM